MIYHIYYTRQLIETDNFGEMQLEIILHSKTLCKHFILFCQVKHEEIFFEVFMTNFLALNVTDIQDPKCLSEFLI